MSSVSSTMRSLEVTAYGEPSTVLTFNEKRATPTLKNGNHVLVKVHSAAMNAIDFKIARGQLTMLFPKTLPFIPGYDAAGEVVAVGAAVKSLKVGDRVYGYVADGATMAEYCVAPEHQFGKIPDSLNYNQAAAVAIVALTSYQALFVAAKLSTAPGGAAGQRVLVLGGASATGNAAIQMAKAVGAFVATTASTRNVDFVRAAGADQVIDYSKGEKYYEVLAGGEKFNVVYDTIGEELSWENSKKILAKNGLFAQINRGSAHAAVGVGFMMGLAGSIIGRKFGEWFGSDGHRYLYHICATSASSQLDKQFQQINQWINEGKLRVSVDKTYAFNKEAALDMFQLQESGKTKGKLILEIIPSSSSSAGSGAAASNIDEKKN